MRRVFLWITLHLTASVGLALPPEGLENYALLNRGKSSTGLSSAIIYSNPIWTSDYESLDVIGNSQLGQHLLTFGGRVTVANYYGDRSAYFGRFDLVLGKLNSLSVKWTHEDWKYISSSKDSFGLEYNHFWAVGEKSGFYFVFGGYYRYLKQRWDKPWYSPFNLNTKDREGYFVGTAGFKISLGESSFYTFDINTRDAWAYYGLDNVAFDLKLYLGGKGFYFTLLGGVRTSATWVGTVYPANYYGGAGFVVY